MKSMPDGPTNIEDTAIELEPGVRFLARHLVSLCWIDRTPGHRDKDWSGNGQPVATSGFVVSIRENWFLMTAGHVLRAIATALERGQQLEDWHLDDGWSIDRKFDTPIPFDFANAFQRSFGDESGLDYGLLHLRPLYRLQLERNGVIALDEARYAAEWPKDFDGYVLLGIPSEGVEPVSENVLSKPCWTIPLTKVSEPCAKLVKGTPRWYGKIKGENPLPIKSLEGMSGGPIFGFKHLPDGQPRYWIIAVQSSWVARTREIAACPIQPFMRMLKSALGSLG